MNKYQNRRDFLIYSARQGLIAGLGFFGISLVNNNLTYADTEKCPRNLTCGECYKMGVCPENKAAETRNEIKRNGLTAKISKGANHG